MSCKRSFPDQDPDYEDNVSSDKKRLKVIENDNREATVRKIEQIIRTQFTHEVQLKQDEINVIEDRLYETVKMLDQVRKCIITSYYSFDVANETTLSKASPCQPPIHPNVKKYLGKAPKVSSSSSLYPQKVGQVATTSQQTFTDFLQSQRTSDKVQCSLSEVPSTSKQNSVGFADDLSCVGSRAARFKIKKRIVVGNVSKYIPIDKREDRDQSTHKWMVYVRGPKEEPMVENFVKKVWFFLHPSYRPNDLVEVSQPPFHLTRRGWGEFPVRVQLHFNDPRNKRVDVIHTLKLDKTYTGLQTLGAETIVDVLIYKPDLLIHDSVEQQNSRVYSASLVPQQQHSIPQDVGGITIPAVEIKNESQIESPRRNRIIEERIKRGKTLIKVEPADDVDGNLRNCVQSFMNDHGGYLGPVNVDQVKSEHSYQAEHPNVGAGFQTGFDFPLLTKIKQEPLEYSDDFDENSAKKMSHVQQSSDDSFDSGIQKDVVPKLYNREDCASEMDLPGNRKTPRKLFTPENCAQQIPSIVTSTPSTSSLVDEKQYCRISPEVVDSKSVGQVQPNSNNGVAAFVKCGDKQGNLYLIPLAVFLKMNPNVNTAALQQSNPLPNSSLLKGPTGSVSGLATASALSTSSSSSLSPIVVLSSSAASTTLSPAAGAMMKLTPNNASSTTVLSTDNQSLAQASTSSSGPIGPVKMQHLSSPKSLITAVHSKLPHIIQTNNATARSLLQPQKSVSLLSGGLSTSMTKSSTSNSSVTKSVFSNSCFAADTIGRKSTSTSESAEIRLDVDNFETMDGILHRVVKHFPLVMQNPGLYLEDSQTVQDRSVHPYCSNSTNDFLNWNVGKRHAAEWQRAKAVRNKLLALVKDSSKWKPDSVWTTKRLFHWFRYYGYSPMKSDLHDYADADGEDAIVGPSESYTESTELLDKLLKMQENLTSKELPDSEDHLEIDVITVNDKPTTKTKLSPEKPKISSFCMPSTSTGVEIVQDAVSQIGIRLLPEDVGNDAAAAPLAEEALLSAMKQFMESIMRSSLASTFRDSKTKSRCPNVIGVRDVIFAISQTSHCDFLTNRFLGTKLHEDQFINYSDVKL